MTITARNYAAQAQHMAERSISVSQPNLILKDFQIGASTAIHFALPDGGEILSDNLRGLIGETVRLPFDTITVEYREGLVDFCTLAKETESGEIEFIVAFRNPLSKWDFLPAKAFFSGAVDAEDIAVSFEDADIPNVVMEAATVCVIRVLGLCEALACSNVDSEVIEPVDQRKNAKRIKQRKLPIYETRRLVIKAPLTRSEGSHSHGNSDRQGPREHLRRGHIRRLQDGRRIWVQSCVVVSRENGVIHKSYAITN